MSTDPEGSDEGSMECPEPGCVKSFRKLATMAVGEHVYHNATCSTDVAIELLAKKCNESLGYNLSSTCDTSIADSTVENSEEKEVPTSTEKSKLSAIHHLKTGWVLKGDRKGGGTIRWTMCPVKVEKFFLLTKDIEAN